MALTSGFSVRPPDRASAPVQLPASKHQFAHCLANTMVVQPPLRPASKLVLRRDASVEKNEGRLDFCRESRRVDCGGGSYKSRGIARDSDIERWFQDGLLLDGEWPLRAHDRGPQRRGGASLPK
jgi:hypothetical protein